MSDFPTTRAPWDVEPTPPAVEQPQESENPHTLSYKLGLLEGAMEVAIVRLENTDEELIADGLRYVLKRVKEL